MNKDERYIIGFYLGSRLGGVRIFWTPGLKIYSFHWISGYDGIYIMTKRCVWYPGVSDPHRGPTLRSVMAYTWMLTMTLM